MPGLRENIMERLSRDLIIDPEFAALIPPLTPDEFSGLEKSILEEGCRDALIVWGNIIIDGHNRFNICSKHNIPYRTEYRDFPNREAAMLWMLQNQLSRRNLNDFQRVEMVRKCEQAVKAQAEQRMLKGKSDPSPKLGKGRASDELGRLAGVSHNTYEHAAAVLDKAPEPVVQATRKNELSINAAYEVTKLPEEKQQEVSRRISQGEKPKYVIASVKSQKFECGSYTSHLEVEHVKKHVYTVELRQVQQTLDLIQGNCSKDCILFLWVTPDKLNEALSSIFRSNSTSFQYINIAFVWTCASEVKELCLIGARGNTKIHHELRSKVIDAQAEGNNQRPNLFNELLQETIQHLLLS